MEAFSKSQGFLLYFLNIIYYPSFRSRMCAVSPFRDYSDVGKATQKRAGKKEPALHIGTQILN
jgi:hypothetical protein